MVSKFLKSLPHFELTPLKDDQALKAIPDLRWNDESDLVSGCRDYLRACDDKIIEMTAARLEPISVCRLRSIMIDRLVQNLFIHYLSEFKGLMQGEVPLCTLMATGGYGRQEMALYSDVDLLLLHEQNDDAIFQPLMEKVLYVLWDLKLDVGHAVRKVSECRKLMLDDQTIMTSLMDVRFLAGNPVLASKINQVIEKTLRTEQSRRSLFRSKVRERVSRLKKYGGSIYVLEPQMKEGQGGLRDLQLIRWIGQIFGIGNNFEDIEAAGYLDHDDVVSLDLSLNYLFFLRNQLHVLRKRKGDQLTFDVQREIADQMGYSDTEGELGVEKFMQVYYAVASHVTRIVKNLIQMMHSEQRGLLVRLAARFRQKRLDSHFKIVNGKVSANGSHVFEKEPINLLKAFEYVQELGFGLHYRTKQYILQNLHLVNDDFRRNPEVRARFKQMMSNYDNLGKTLFAMHDVHFFDALLPEFRRVRNRMQHDAYHVYTVDTHSIFAINELSKLHSDQQYAQDFPSYRQAMMSVQRADLLAFSLLYHDIGKGEGGSHSVVGAEIAVKAMERLGYSEEDQKIVEFHVLSHLLMPHLSQRRDLEDFNMVSEFAKAIGSMEMLNILFVLTWADIRAVSAEAWTEWKGRLLDSLYDKTKAILLENQGLEDIVQRRVADVRKAILARMHDMVDGDKLQKFLRNISPRYVLAHTDEEIFEHFHLITSHDDESLLFVDREIEEETISEILIYTLLNPRVVPLVTGVMLAMDINILSMESFQLSDGHVFLKMTVQGSQGDSLQMLAVVDRLKEYLQDVFTGKRNVTELIAKRQPPSFLKKDPVRKDPTHVSVDNDVSAYYTVIDVYTHNRVGLLYDIVNCLVEQGCYVEMSKISTKVEQVVDSFYVKDIFGHKILSKPKLQEIKNALKAVIDDDVKPSGHINHAL